MTICKRVTIQQVSCDDKSQKSNEGKVDVNGGMILPTTIPGEDTSKKGQDYEKKFPGEDKQQVQRP